MKHSTRLLRCVPLLVLCAAAATAQCGSLSTVFNGGTFCTNGGGPMFDVVALNPAGIHVNAVDANLNAGTHVISVYAITGGGTFVGNELNAAAWTLVGTATVTSTGPGVPTLVPLVFDVFVPPGATQGLHVRNAGGGLRYSSASPAPPVGSILAADANIQILVGSSQCSLTAGGGPPFVGSVPSPRLFNGTIHYDADYQVNSAAASLDFDGVQGTLCTAASITKMPGVLMTLNIASTNTGAPFEVVFAFTPLVARAAGAFQTPLGQIVNVDLSQALFLNGGAVPLFAPFPGNLSFTFPAPFSGVTLSAQLVIVDPLHPEGLVLSQGGEVVFL